MVFSMSLPSADVAVIGAGIIGSSIAWRLAQSGCNVALLDAGVLGGEASWAGAGMLSPGELEERSPWTDFAFQSLALYPEFVAELQRESGFTIDYQRHGALDLAFTPEEWDELQRRAPAQRAMGLRSVPLDPARAREMAPLIEPVAGALYFPDDALVNPRHITYTLQTACERRGVQIHEHHRVTAIHARKACVEIDTPPGILSVRCAVISAGAWSGEISVRHDGEPVPTPASFPVRGHLLGYSLPAGSLGPTLRYGRTYIVQRANGFTVAGSSLERVGFDREIDQSVVADIHERACAMLPCLRQATPEPWIGFRPATTGFEPEIRRMEGTNLWLSYGHYRNGILLAPATAARVAGEIIASLGTDSPSSGGCR
jgi:glycine oxidase